MKKGLRWPAVAIGFSGLVILSTGCAGPKLPDYVPPKIAPDQAATLHGFSGTYITVIDNAHVTGVVVRFSNMGGNDVTVGPGWHRITTEHWTGSGTFLNNNTAALEGSFEPGHSYGVGPDNRWNPFKQTIVIRDRGDKSVLKSDE